MKRISAVSNPTLSAYAVLCLFVLSSIVSSAFAEDAETRRLEAEVAQARNAMDAELLKPNAKPTDPKVKEKSALVDEKVQALREHFRKRVVVPKATGPKKVYRVDVMNEKDTSNDKTPDPAADQTREFAPGRMVESAPLRKEEAPPAKEPQPGYTLSSDSVKSEIIYEKKSKGKSAEPEPAPTVENTVEGISEIQYPKKSKK
jgi:hypothetical protein